MAPYESLPPLVSPRSPSYARARRELESPSPTGNPIVVGLLNRLIEVEHDARRACLAAADKLGETDLADQLRTAAAAHDERREALAELVEELGGSPLSPRECRDILNTGHREVERTENDEELGNALRNMYAELTAAYAEAAGNDQLDPKQRTAIEGLAPHAER